MLRSSMQAAVTMGQLQQKLDLIGNNLANMETPGYKTRNSEFASLLYQQIDNLEDEGENPNRLTPDGLRMGSGAKLAHTDIDLSQGSIKETGRALDVALQDEKHLFQVQVTVNGQTETRYTRDGSFAFSPVNDGEVMLVTSNGNPVLGENGPIVMDDTFDDMTIRKDGSIFLTQNGEQNEAGRLAIVNAERPRLLEAAGQNVFRIPQEGIEDIPVNEIVQAVAPQDINTKQGALETSNVDMSKQMTDMVTMQRAYQFNSRSIAMGDQMMGLVNQLR
ncbi:flagellar hook-basal body protein [Pontibacillus salipaludis]|uniref:flagellar hook-basal body protein n=1 Tax=Pontibacillus salipaludis TaxID=1697394 RepID=UPI0031F0907F